ncbi:hypothetical protein AACH06_25315 [Ideonella sp. DXS29W]|uniref:Uncharacterized protein n=1 Tax=Ideonella lacteola TaxID=2984193 RepID=A0ABU9BWM9_9BURK
MIPRLTSRATVVLGLSCLLACSLSAHAAPLQVRSLTMKPPAQAKDLGMYAAGWAEGSIKMPFVIAEPPAAGMRINTRLFIEQFGMPPPPRPGESFSPPVDLLPEGTASLEFQLVRNDERVLAVSLTIEGCGAYCETYEQVYNFDARTGRLLLPSDLFSPSGWQAAGRRFAKEREQRYVSQLKALKKELAEARKSHAQADVVNDLNERIELNQGCLEGAREVVKQSQQGAETLHYASLSLEGAGVVTIHTGRCSAHVNRALDDVGEVSVKFRTAELQPLLSPYGRALVLNQGDAPAPASPFGQILRGQIGGAPVTVMLETPQTDGSVAGRYYYDKYGRMIPIAGRLQGQTLELTEETDGKKAQLSLTLQGASLTGAWQGQGKTVKVSWGW